jgi:hypothetical protein
MSHKRVGQLTVSGQWAKHLRPWYRRAFWKAERNAAQKLVRVQLSHEAKRRGSTGNVEQCSQAIRLEEMRYL